MKRQRGGGGGPEVAALKRKVAALERELAAAKREIAASAMWKATAEQQHVVITRLVEEDPRPSREMELHEIAELKDMLDTVSC